jgi:signal transduction histidine kinase
VNSEIQEITASMMRRDVEDQPIAGELRLFDSVGLPCRLVADGRRVVWQSRALQNMLGPVSELCCESLGLRHTEADCPSATTLRSDCGQAMVRWLGKFYVEIKTTPLRDVLGYEQVSFEVFRDLSSEKRLEFALIGQQELLETINKAMIQINHDLESTQEELERKNVSLEGANNRLRALDQLKDEFISIVSHELKAPLTAIKGSVDLIDQCAGQTLPGNVTELLTVCRRNTNRLHRLVQDLLEIARIESGRLTLGFSRFTVGELIQECLQSVQGLVANKEINLCSEVKQDVRIVADRDRMVQVLVNLLSNAIKFTDRGQVAVEADTEPQRIVFWVRDTGIGIPHEEQTRIFDKFAQVGSVLHRNSGGTGLGLAIVRGIIREHGGEIHVTSAPGEGSCFTFFIPQPPGKDAHGTSGPLD